MFVLDSNVVQAGLFSRRGGSFWLLERALEGRLPFAVSVALALEYEDVLLRPQHVAQSWANADQIETLLNALLAKAVLVQPIRFRQRPSLKDPDDEFVLECALQAQAEAIVTTNIRDFDSVETIYGVRVLRLGELVAELKRKVHE